MVLWTSTLNGIALIHSVVLHGVVQIVKCLGNVAKLGVPTGGGRGTSVLKLKLKKSLRLGRNYQIFLSQLDIFNTDDQATKLG